MEFILTIIFLTLHFLLLPKLAGLPPATAQVGEIRILFLFKLLVGLAAAFYFHNIFIAPDYVMYTESGLEQFALLKNDPRLFVSEIFSGDKSHGLLNATGSYWAGLRFMVVFKFVAIISLITNGNFFLNTLVFSSIVFWGHYAFYRVFNSLYPGKKTVTLACCFFIPSLMMYTACVHKDGIVFFSLGIMSLCIYNLFSRGLVKVKEVAIVLLLSFVIFLVRNYLILTLYPALFATMAYTYAGRRKWAMFWLAYAMLTVLFFLTAYVDAGINLPAALVHRRNEFKLLPLGRTGLPLGPLRPTASSFLTNLPTALNHVFLRPYLWEFKSIAIIATAVELFVFQLLFVAYLFWKKNKQGSVHPFNLFGLGFFICTMTIIGYCVPNAGSIVRYRGILWIFFLTPMLCNIDWVKMRESLRF